MNMALNLTSGTVRKLTVSNERRNLVYTKDLTTTAKGLGVIAAASGMAAEATQVSSTGDTEEELEAYQFEINGERFFGYARVADFNEGDFVEVVYKNNKPEHHALAVRRPSTHNIWVQHFMTKGTYAGVLHAIRLWLGISLTLAFFMLIFIFIGELLLRDWSAAVDFFWTEGVYFPVVAAVTLLIPAPFLAPKFFSYSKQATEVFKAFGFKNPQWIDLEKTSKPKRLTQQQLNEKCKEMHHHDAFIEYRKNGFRYWY